MRMGQPNNKKQKKAVDQPVMTSKTAATSFRPALAVIPGNGNVVADTAKPSTAPLIKVMLQL